MKEMIPTIQKSMKILENTPLCKWLSSSESSSEDRFLFTPSMAFFVLGFRDILEAIRIDNPKTPLEIEINTHCNEDIDHWKWYLNDLERMGFSHLSWGDGAIDVFRRVWDDDAYVVRNMVYDTIANIKKYNDPLISLAIVEVLEAAFGVFITHMLKPIEHLGVYHGLEYFGSLHVEKELSHARGAWEDGERTENEYETHELNENQKQIVNSLVSEMTDNFKKMFAYWYSTRNKYVRFVPSVGVQQQAPSTQVSNLNQ